MKGDFIEDNFVIAVNPKNAFKNREVFVVNEAMNKEPKACSRPREGELAEGITLRQIKVFSEY